MEHLQLYNENTNKPIKNGQIQDRNKDADIENGLEDMGRGKGKLAQVRE